SGVVLIAYGVMTIRAQPLDPAASGPPQDGQPYFWSGFGLGAALILLNPAALITWVVIVGAAPGGGTLAGGWSAAVGICVGSAAWFIFVAYAADHGKRVLGNKAVWVTRIVGVILVGAGVFSLGRTGWLVYRLVEPLVPLFPGAGP